MEEISQFIQFCHKNFLIPVAAQEHFGTIADFQKAIVFNISRRNAVRNHRIYLLTYLAGINIYLLDAIVVFRFAKLQEKKE